VIILFIIIVLGVSDLMFMSLNFKNCFCLFILRFLGLITIRFFLDFILNLYFDFIIRGIDIVLIDWTA